MCFLFGLSRCRNKDEKTFFDSIVFIRKHFTLPITFLGVTKRSVLYSALIAHSTFFMILNRRSSNVFLMFYNHITTTITPSPPYNVTHLASSSLKITCCAYLSLVLAPHSSNSFGGATLNLNSKLCMLRLYAQFSLRRLTSV